MALSQCLAEEISYRHAFVLDNNYGEVSDEQLNSLPEKDRTRLLNDIQAQAAHGLGFWYERHAIKGNDQKITDDLLTWLNSDALLGVIAQLTGADKYGGAIAQATRYLPGDFLTRHKDVVTEEKRKIAFSLTCHRDGTLTGGHASIL